MCLNITSHFIVGVEFFEASAKDNVNVKPVFDCLVDSICENMSEVLDAEAALSRNRTTELKGDDDNAAPTGCKC